MQMVKTQEGDPLRYADTGVVLTYLRNRRLGSSATAIVNVHKTAPRAQSVSPVGEMSYDRKRVCRNLCADNKWL